MMKKGHLLTVLLVWLTMLPAEAQTLLTLDECLRMGIERNLGLSRRQNQMRRSKEAISESRSNLLPQINAYFNLNDNFKETTNVAYVPASDVFSVSEVMHYNAQGGLQLSMPLYNQSLYTAISVKKLLADIDGMQYEKARQDLIMQISRLYYLGQMTMEQIRLVDENIARLTQLRDITQSLADNGVALEVDVQRVDINLKDLQVRHKNAQSLHQQQLNTLKYLINYTAGADIALVTMATDAAPAMPQLTGVSAMLPELQLLQGQQEVSEKQVSLVKQGYLPTLNLTGQLAWNTFSDKFSGWLDGASAYNKWYNNYGIGLSLRVPVFDGLNKKYRLRQAKLDSENAHIQMEDTRLNFEKEYANAINDLENNRRTYEDQLANLRLAEQVYGVTADRYKEGLAGMTEVLQDEISINSAQNSYVQALYNCYTANLTLLKLTGQLDSLMKR